MVKTWWRATQTRPVLSRQQTESVEIKKSWASTLITTSTSFHLPQPVSTDLIMGFEAGQYNKTFTHKVCFCGTITRNMANQGLGDIFSPWGKTDLAGYRPSISTGYINSNLLKWSLGDTLTGFIWHFFNILIDLFSFW